MLPRRFTKLAVIAAIGVVGLLVSAGTASAGPFDSCSTATVALPDGGGTTVVAGKTGTCRASTGTGFITRILSNGNPDKNFGKKGISLLGESDQYGKSPQAMVKVDGKFIISGDTFAVRVNGDGTIDSSYGDGGFLSWDQGSVSTLRGDGQLAVASRGGLSETGPPLVLRRFDQDGQPIGGFGTDGIESLDLGELVPASSGPFKIAMGDDGSLAVVMWGFGETIRVVRVTVTGTLDSSFGPGGSGVFDLGNAYPCDGCEVQVYEPQSLRMLDDGSLRLLTDVGSVEDTAFRYRGWAVTITPTGSGVTDSIVVERPGQPMLELENGDLVGSFMAVGGLVDRKLINKLNVSKADSNGNPGFSGGVRTQSLRVSPDGAVVRDIVKDQANGQLIVLGEAKGTTCTSTCEDGRRALVTRLNVNTGKPVAAFGKNGTVLLPTGCAAGRSDGSTGTSWPRCAVPRVTVTPEANFEESGKSRPYLSAFVSLKKFKSAPMDSVFRATITLPKALTLTSKAKSRISATSWGWDLGFKRRPATRFQIKGRTLYLSYSVKAGTGWPGAGTYPSEPDLLTFWVKFKGGSLEPVPKGSGKLVLKATGSITPTASSRWYGPSSGKGRAVIKRR